MKRIIKANYNRQNNLNSVLDNNDRERYIHTLIGDLQTILNKKGINIEVSDIDYSLIIDIIGDSRRDVIDTVVVPYREIIYDWDNVYFAADKIAEKVLEEARI